MRKRPFIALEGLSGVGKSAVANILADRLNGLVYKVPPPPFQDIRDQVDHLCDITARYFFYLSAVVYSSSQIGVLLNTGPVICDRYVLTTHCYQTAAGLASAVPIQTLEILQPDMTVLVGCAEDERLRRLKSRGLSYNDQIEQDLQIDRILLQRYKDWDLFEVDNTTLSPKETADVILKQLNLEHELDL